MIKRHVYTHIEKLLKQYPIVAISGPRQVGKSTLAYQFVKNYNFHYISLENMTERFEAIKDPQSFIEKFSLPLIIDEVQYVPQLLDVVVSIVNRKRLKEESSNGLFIITGSQAYELMQKITETMAGRVAIIKLNALSQREIDHKDPKLLKIDRHLANIEFKLLDELSLFRRIVRGYYPSLHQNYDMDVRTYFQNYVATYINRDVTKILNIKDLLSFNQFMQLLASYTGQELIVLNIAKILGKNSNTIKDWISVLVTSGIIHLLYPYNEASIVKRIVKRPKIYFSDTGLAAYLLNQSDDVNLLNSNYAGAFFETFVVNEIKKNVENSGFVWNAYYYRDNNQNEIDLILLDSSRLCCLEIKKGTNYTKSSIKSFSQLKNTQYELISGGIICSAPHFKTIDENNFLIPYPLI